MARSEHERSGFDDGLDESQSYQPTAPASIFGTLGPEPRSIQPFQFCSSSASTISPIVVPHEYTVSPAISPTSLFDNTATGVHFGHVSQGLEPTAMLGEQALLMPPFGYSTSSSSVPTYVAGHPLDLLTYPQTATQPWSEQQGHGSVPWQHGLDTSVPPSWPPQSSSSTPLTTQAPSLSFMSYPSGQLIADCLKPMDSYYHDSSDTSGQDTKGPAARLSKNETLRKRRSNNMGGAQPPIASTTPTARGGTTRPATRDPEMLHPNEVTPPVRIQSGHRSGGGGGSAAPNRTRGKRMRESTSSSSPPATQGASRPRMGLLDTTGITTTTGSTNNYTRQSNQKGSGKQCSVHGPPLEEETGEEALLPVADNARLKHNSVERKYRNRLNKHFEQLLDALPPTMGDSLPDHRSQQQLRLPPLLAAPTTIQDGNSGELEDQTDYIDRGVGSVQGGRQKGFLAAQDRSPATPTAPPESRRVSKSEVLDRAILYIRSLENGQERLMADRKELRRWWETYGKSVAGDGGFTKDDC
ncbi:hypothetical protein B0H66DRAFT_250324 [Apodospora peruviana]|uniref:BHLH domain-containing protein n=1 Tax=Apodospora peruviana TaxID=516989 RepID=A0AAE0M4V9_9PEZI|nr:hypothetical protein B0H66DRAFT_250324 [Apodospora peruviana]